MEVPDADRPFEASDVRRLARRLIRATVRAARVDEGLELAQLLREHLGPGAGGCSVVRETWRSYDRVNVQAALDAWLVEPGRRHWEIGFHNVFDGLSLSALLADDARLGVGLAPVSRVNMPSGPDGQTLPCTVEALYLVDEPGADGAKVAMLLGAGERGGAAPTLDIGSTTPGVAEATAARLRRLTIERNVFRGHLLSFSPEMFGYDQSALTFHRRPDVRRDDVILGESVLEAIERQVIGVARHKIALAAAGQHLKRGLLLYGPPGVGKTHTVRYLANRLSDTTILQLSGSALGLIGEACSVARSLQPSVLVVEDVDLIAEDRDSSGVAQPLLFELLQEMDGLEGDSDVTFILTTNRADVLEPALAQRPGRVDQAVELNLPDLDARRRLFELYRGGLAINVPRAELEGLLARTEGVTASFLKEWVRRAALVAAERTDPWSAMSQRDFRPADALSVDGDDLRIALDDLLSTRNAMTRAVLGGQPGTQTQAGEGTPWPS